jgi:hypothetical protein
MRYAHEYPGEKELEIRVMDFLINRSTSLIQ